MKELKTINERAILYYAWSAIMEIAQKESEFLERNPDNFISKTRLEKFKAQEKEIHDRILEIENGKI